ncbi:MAG: alpha-ketoacid dehydrogenase subunit beta [Candidatus Poribacteria bacterium]|nr:alpha-ketoacid dehydrogenase subunit beta [Candidatus Poribacteria bacterium]
MTELVEMNMIQALNNALDIHMHRESNAIIMGEDIGGFGGVFRVTEGLQQKYGPDRVFDTPLAETGIVGSAIGMALAGLQPIVEIQFADFVFPAFDQIVSEAAKYRYRSGGQYSIKMVIRMPYGGGIRGGHYHSQSPEAYFAHTPGLRVVIPSGPYQAKGLLLAALNCPDPVIFLEPKKIYRSLKAHVPEAYYAIPLEKATVVREGRDTTLVAYGAMMEVAREAVLLAEGEGYDIELIDLLSILPYDFKTVVTSVEKTGRLVVIQEAPRTCGFAAELLAEVQERAFTRLQAPLQRVTGFDTPFPYTLEDHYLPRVERVLDVLTKTIEY